jgi:hypothetical protein
MRILDIRNVAKSFSTALYVRSMREYHADMGGFDDRVQFCYSVLPLRE